MIGGRACGCLVLWLLLGPATGAAYTGRKLMTLSSADKAKLDSATSSATNAATKVTDLVATVSKDGSQILSFVKLASPALGAIGGLVSLALVFVPAGDDPTLKAVTDGFAKVNTELDKINSKLDGLLPAVAAALTAQEYANQRQRLKDLIKEYGAFSESPRDTGPLNKLKNSCNNRSPQDFLNYLESVVLNGGVLGAGGLLGTSGAIPAHAKGDLKVFATDMQVVLVDALRAATFNGVCSSLLDKPETTKKKIADNKLTTEQLADKLSSAWAAYKGQGLSDNLKTDFHAALDDGGANSAVADSMKTKLTRSEDHGTCTPTECDKDNPDPSLCAQLGAVHLFRYPNSSGKNTFLAWGDDGLLGKTTLAKLKPIVTAAVDGCKGKKPSDMACCIYNKVAADSSVKAV
ncbi:hypothetical protein WJX72_001117 [[Myrmecia] bisecta]|uniref:Uncharacterized protein n=1 Tax=[Myrmecia] bisecta TaxID=41462 RepID=A0AAW1PP91_9CHLO